MQGAQDRFASESDPDGQRARITSTFVRTGGVVERHNLEEKRYIELKK